MLIQNTGNLNQFQQPSRFLGDSGTSAAASKNKVAENAPIELPKIVPIQTPEQQLLMPQLKNAVDSINKFLQQSNKNIQFSVDADTQKTVVKLIDSETGEVVRQYPSNEVLAISKSIENMQNGLLLKQRA